MATLARIIPFLWFDDQAEAAANHYTSIFKNSQVVDVQRYGASWQIVPTVLTELPADPDPAKAGRVTQAMLGMGRIDIEALEDAYQGT
jgi:predicted 3-demethylubiquinone-9 3-methyltransferase (glyoxalase superfamily)